MLFKQKKNKTINKTTNKHKKEPVVKKESNPHITDRLRATWLILMGAIALFLLLCLFSYSSQDPGWTVAQSNSAINNYAGIVGAYTANFILTICGIFGFLIPFILIYGVWQLFLERKTFAESSMPLMLMRFIGLILLIAAGSGIADITLSIFNNTMPEGSGGILGQEIAKYITNYLSTTGGLFSLIFGFALGLTLFSGAFWLRALSSGLLFLLRIFINFFSKDEEEKAALAEQKAQKRQEKEALKAQKQQDKIEQKTQKIINKNAITTESDELEPVSLSFEEPKISTPSTALFESIESDPIIDDTTDLPPPPAKRPAKNKKPRSLVTTPHQSIDGLPSLDLLDDPQAKKEKISDEFLLKMAALVEEKLADFGIQAKVVGSYPGPVITRFEIELAPGVKVSKLSGLAQDLARSLSAARVRVVEVIPGKPYVGLELPNQKRQMVRLKEVLAHEKFTRSDSPLTMGFGVDIAGAPETANLAKMPHLLVAGTTGSGKSVGVNAMIISMLYKSTPSDLRLIMIDPKMLELSIYEGIPHLLTPVVTDMNEAANALRWCVKEMDRRYELMAAAGVRNIAGLNEKIKEAKAKGEPMKDPLWIKPHPGQEEDAPELEKLPFVVVIADEFADMMMVVGKKVEELIARLAQKARAAGVHLILATQRPSVDVVTGLIKANIPTRIAFQVSSKIDSRTILDQQGAEQLLGHGDMLYLPPGSGVPSRVHGAFVDDDEVHRVVGAWKEMGAPNYVEDITASEEDTNGDESVESSDPLYDEAVKIVIETQRASISSIQRRLRIGYNRSARLIEEMENAGIVSEMQSNGMREVLIKR